MRMIKMGKITGRGKMGLDKERNEVFLHKRAWLWHYNPFQVTVVPSVMGSPFSPGLEPLQQGDEAGGGYLGLEVSVVWLPQKGTSA